MRLISLGGVYGWCIWVDSGNIQMTNCYVVVKVHVYEPVDGE